jgi:hypothetical protein
MTIEPQPIRHAVTERPDAGRGSFMLSKREHWRTIGTPDAPGRALQT